MYDVGERIPNVPFDLARRHTRQRLDDTVLGTYSGSILSVESNKNVESKTKNVESNIAFGQLILRKIIKTVAIRCQILMIKCTEI